MMDETDGWGMEASGHILHTKDGGVTWEDVTPPQGAYREGGFFALDSRTAWASPYCLGSLYGIGNLHFCDGNINQTTVWMTHDGGMTWEASTPICVAEGCPDPISSSGDGSLLPESIRFIDPQHGWLVISRGGSMNQNRYNGFYTNDGGRSWNFLISARKNKIVSGSIAALEPLDEKNLYLFTNETQGAYIPYHDLEYSLSRDGGKTWNQGEGDFEIPAVDVVLSSITPKPYAHRPGFCGTIESRAIPPLVLDLTQACHYYDESNRTIYYFIHLHSEDGGRTWASWQQTGDVDFIDAKTGWDMVSKGNHLHEIRQTRDGGLTWSAINTVAWDGILDFVNDRTGYALAYDQGNTAVLYTSDGGKSWEIRSQATVAHVLCLMSTWSVCDR
jgi:photosystem II stability/assembly factor-like uncharacterized protein